MSCVALGACVARDFEQNRGPDVSANITDDLGVKAVQNLIIGQTVQNVRISVVGREVEVSVFADAQGRQRVIITVIDHLITSFGQIRGNEVDAAAIALCGRIYLENPQIACVIQQIHNLGIHRLAVAGGVLGRAVSRNADKLAATRIRAEVAAEAECTGVHACRILCREVVIVIHTVEQILRFR